MKRFFRWVYDWITVLAGVLVGAPSILLELLHYVEFIDFSPWVGSDRALQVVTGVALAKAILAFIESRIEARS